MIKLHECRCRVYCATTVPLACNPTDLNGAMNNGGMRKRVNHPSNVLRNQLIAIEY